MTAEHDRQNITGPIDLLRERAEYLAKAANEWLNVKDIADEEQARRCDDILAQLGAQIKAVAAQEQAEKKPHRDAISEIGKRFSLVTLTLTTARSLLAPLRERWLQRERTRLAAAKAAEQAEAERLRQEALQAAEKAQTVEGAVYAAETQRRAQEAAKAAAAPPGRAQVRGQYAPRAASIRTLWRAEVEDIVACFVYYQEHPDMLALLTKLASAEAPAAHKEGREIPGCKLVAREIAA